MLNNQDFTVERSKYLGGSDIGAILGLSKYRTALEVWMEKTGKSQKTHSSLPLRFGSFAESFVANEYSQITGSTLVDWPHILIHPSHSFLAGHIDRFVMPNHFAQDGDSLFDSEGRCVATHILECKTANPFAQSDWGEAGTDQILMSYLVQCLWYLMLTGLERADLAVLFGNSDFRIYTIERDLALEEALLEKAIDFWESYVKTDVQPPAQNEIDLKMLFAKSAQGKVIEAKKSTVDLLATLPKLQDQLNDCEARISRIKQAVMAEMQDAEQLTFDGQTLATWKAPKPTYRLDVKKLEQAHPQLTAQYQIPVANGRRLVFKRLEQVCLDTINSDQKVGGL